MDFPDPGDPPGIATRSTLAYELRALSARTDPMTYTLLAGLYLIVANLAAFWLFLHDKRAAIAGRRRIPEDRLLAVAFLGGSIGAKAGQLALRHKIRKEPFRQQLNGILAMQIVAMAAAFALFILQRDLAGFSQI